MNTLMVVRITKASFEDWKKTFQADTERRSAWMNTDEYQIGKVDEDTALLMLNVTNFDALEEMMTSEDFLQMEADLGLSHERYSIGDA